MSHKDVLKLLMPLELGGAHDADQAVEAAALDRALLSADRLTAEMHPDSTELLLSHWERTYGITPDPQKATYLRQQLLTARVADRGGLSVPHLQSVLMAFLGYAPQIEEYRAPYCDDPRTLTDDALFAMTPELVWQFRVVVDNAALRTAGYYAADLQRVINDLKPAHTQGVLDTGSIGFFADDPNSVTDLSLLAL